MTTPGAATPVDNDLRRDECPVCAGPVAPVGVMHLAPAIQFSTHWIAPRRPPELWRCARCGTAFTQYALPEPAAMSLYATGDGGARWSGDAPFERTKTREALALLRRLLRPGVRVLDVGCNTGDLLDFARGLGAVTHGVEPSDVSRAAARAKGHDVVASLDAAAGPFDVVTAFDVLEHLYDVRGVLAAVGATLAPGGRLVVLTGDITCAAARAAGAGWWYVQCPEHVVFPTLQALGGVPGWEVDEAVTTFAAVSHEPGLIRRALAALRGLARADLHDHMLVVLKKKG